MHITINKSPFSTCFLPDFKMAEELRKGSGTTLLRLSMGSPKELGHGSFGAVFLRKCDRLGDVAVKVYSRRGDRDTEHNMMVLLATSNARSTSIIAFYVVADVEVPTSHASSFQQTPQEAPTPICPGLLFEHCTFGDVEGFLRKWHPVLNQTILCHWTSHVAEGLKFLDPSTSSMLI